MILNILLALLPILGLGENAVAQQSQTSLKDDTTTQYKEYYSDSKREKIYDFEYDGLYYEFADGDNVTLVREYTLYINILAEMWIERIYQEAYDIELNKCYTGDIIVPDSVEYEGKRFKVAYLNPYALSFNKGLKSITFTSPFQIKETNDKYGTLFPILYNQDLISLSYPDGMTEIYGQVFSCRSLTDIRLPNELVYIRKSFRDIGVSEINLDKQGSSIPSKYTLCDFSFGQCENLTRAIMPQCDTLYLDSFNFWACTNMKQIIFRPCSTIEMIGMDVLVYPILDEPISMKVVSEAVTPPNIILTDAGVKVGFNTEYRKMAILYVPDEAMEAYGEAYYWCDFGEIRPMSEYLREENAAIDRPVCEAAEMAEPQISLRSDRGELHLTASTPAEVTVWSLQGLPLWRGTVVDEAAVTLPAGVYIVTTPTSSRKYRH